MLCTPLLTALRLTSPLTQVMRLNSERLVLERENNRLKDQVPIASACVFGCYPDADADHVARHVGII
jgi:hypothetical protein